jgi:hypothetical protein
LQRIFGSAFEEREKNRQLDTKLLLTYYQLFAL